MSILEWLHKKLSKRGHDMASTAPTNELFCDPKKKIYYLQPYAVDKQTGFTVDTGKPIRLTADEFATQGVDTIVGDLKGFSDRVPLSHEEQAACRMDFPTKVFRCVGVTLCADVLRLSPMRSEDGGLVGYPEDVIELDVSRAHDELLNSIELAFSRTK